MERALKEPIKFVIENKLGTKAAPIIDKIDQEGNFFAGYDVKQGITLPINYNRENR